MDIRSRVNVWESLIAGATAWLVLNVFVYAVAPLLGITFGVVAFFFGSLVVPGADLTAQLWLGRVLFFGAALGWGLLYRQIAQFLPGPGWLQGMLFGIGIWFASAVLLPIIGMLHPISGSGALSGGVMSGSFPGFMGLGFRGGSGLILSVLAHAAFGATLGALSERQARRA